MGQPGVPVHDASPFNRPAPAPRVRVVQLFPHGGPSLGGTRVIVTGTAFADVGDLRCRFGVQTVPAILLGEDGTALECTTPACERPSCVSGRGWDGDNSIFQTDVPLEVSLNGVTFTNSHLVFTYYTAGSFHVRALTPSGGPRHGGTRVSIAGIGFRDFSAPAGGPAAGGTDVTIRGTQLVNHGGVFCRFASYAGDVDGTVGAEWVDSRTITCRSPPAATNATESGDVLDFGGGNASGFSPRHVDVSLNGQPQFARAPTPFWYYAPGAPRLSSIYPQGGVREGGAPVTVHGTGFADLGGAAGNGLACSFGDAPLVPATLAASAGGGGPQKLRCTSPPLDAEVCGTVDVRVAMNGVALSDDALGFTYHEIVRPREQG